MPEYVDDVASSHILILGVTSLMYAPSLPVLGYQIVTGKYFPHSDIFVYLASILISLSCVLTPLFYAWQHPAIWQPAWEWCQERICRRERTSSKLFFDD